MSKTETNLIHRGSQFNQTKAVVTPIYQTSTYFAGDDLNQYIIAATDTKYPSFYHRHGNPTNSQAAAVLASLENTEDALVLATGMAAISTAVLAVVQTGDHIITQHALYSGAMLFFRNFLTDYGITVSYIDQKDNSAIADAVQENTKLIYIETPSNPNLDVTDIQFVAELGKKHHITTMVDNTFASPINQTPTDFGIDVVVHSATKYLGGHSDLTAGAVCGRKAFIEKVWNRSLMLGGSLSPMDSWLLLRGLKTLSLRVNQINSNALALAQFLEKHPAIHRVAYVGLASHPQASLVKQQMRGGTGMLCIEVVGETDDQAYRHAQSVLDRLQVFANAASLGGVESLVVHPASMWGSHHDDDQKSTSGITNGMLRISVGIEHIDDLIEDFRHALSAIS